MNIVIIIIIIMIILDRPWTTKRQILDTEFEIEISIWQPKHHMLETCYGAVM
jgi:hypothetical protein